MPKLSRWNLPDNWVRWHIRGCPSTLTPRQVFDAFAFAARAWNRVCGIRLVPANSLRGSNIQARFAVFPAKPSELAISGYPSETMQTLEQVYHAGRTWTVRHGATYDLCSVALHELGHAIGIGHLSPGNIMSDDYCGLRTLGEGDIREALRRYPCI